jgi:plastocyanin domain-containing protein
MLRAAALSISLVVSLAACKKGEADAKKAPPPIAGTPTPVAPSNDGVRHIAITADTSGYKPDKIPGKPGEKLMLVFTRTADSTCISQLVTPDKKTVDLPMNSPVEVAVTVPQTGEVGFACGMDMFHGTVVADPSI